MKFPRVVIAGTHSGVGKTSLAIGIMAALKARGRVVQGFKVGPDYIDPTYHTAVTGLPSRNLDRFLLQECFKSVFINNARDRFAVIEGVMGLFDGLSGKDGFGSTADIAVELQAPVILVVDSSAMARSVAAVAHGYRTFDSRLRVAGVILNRVGSPAHERLLKEALAGIDCPVIGAVPDEALVKFPERHLGLVPIGENRISESDLRRLIEAMEQYLDLEQIETIMQEAPDLPDFIAANSPAASGVDRRSQPNDWRYRIGIAWDEGFLFYYRDALDVMALQGMELVPFSPLRDSDLPPDLDGLILGGGFPEVYLPQLSANRGMYEALRRFAASKKPIYAECGGYMYLGERIIDGDGQEYAGVGLIPMTSKMTGRLQGLGYREGVINENSFLAPRGTVVRGHEFHYSLVEFHRPVQPAYTLYRGGKYLRDEGYCEGNIFGSYLHIHFAGQPSLIEHWRAWLDTRAAADRL